MISALIKETPESSPPSLAMWGYSSIIALHEPGSRRSTDTNLLVPWSWTPQPPELWEHTFLFFATPAPPPPCPVCGTSFWQPWPANVAGKCRVRIWTQVLSDFSAWHLLVPWDMPFTQPQPAQLRGAEDRVCLASAWKRPWKEAGQLQGRAPHIPVLTLPGFLFKKKKFFFWSF